MQVFKVSCKDTSEAILWGKYTEWREELERKQKEKPSCVGNIWDCAFKEARIGFSEYAGLKEEAPMEIMLCLEARYEKEVSEVCT